MNTTAGQTSARIQLMFGIRSEGGTYRSYRRRVSASYSRDAYLSRSRRSFRSMAVKLQSETIPALFTLADLARLLPAARVHAGEPDMADFLDGAEVLVRDGAASDDGDGPSLHGRILSAIVNTPCNSAYYTVPAGRVKLSTRIDARRTPG